MAPTRRTPRRGSPPWVCFDGRPATAEAETDHHGDRRTHGHRGLELSDAARTLLERRPTPVEGAGLLVSRTDVDAGRQRRRYRATDHGQSVLAECRAALAELAHECLPDNPTGQHR